MATAQNMADDLRQMIGNPTSTSITDATLFDLLNKAAQKLSDEFRFKGAKKRVTFPTVIGTNQYTLPTDIFAVRQVWDRTNGKKLNKRGVNWLARNSQALVSSPITNGKPTDYVSFGTYVQLVPPPDGVYTIELYYTIQMPTLVNPTDVSLLPPNWHDGVVLKARWYYWDRVKPDYTKAAYALNVFKDWVRDQPTDVEAETYDIDSAVEVPTLAHHHHNPRLDFDHRDD